MNDLMDDGGISANCDALDSDQLCFLHLIKAVAIILNIFPPLWCIPHAT